MLDLSIVIPVYKEEDSILPFLNRMESVLEKMGVSYEIIFALDPSPDKTELIISSQILRNSKIRLITFSRRFGQPAATIAGILNCSGRACVVIDVDLQDPPEIVAEMYPLFLKGNDVVYAKRRSRKGETLVKLIVSYFGYKVINKLSEVEIPTNTGDFRILSRRVIEELRRLNEGHGFLRGLVAYIGYKQAFVEYDRDQRFAGPGNYNRWIGSLKIGLNGLISFSSRPLLLMSLSGFVLAGFSFLLGFWYVLQKLIGFDLTPGLSTTVLFITFFSGVQLLGLGLIGEYVGRIYDEVKRRPMYIVDKKINFKDSNNDI
jgi:glycosyltransferase involved in cell wall biosynthesis